MSCERKYVGKSQDICNQQYDKYNQEEAENVGAACWQVVQVAVDAGDLAVSHHVYA